MQIALHRVTFSAAVSKKKKGRVNFHIYKIPIHHTKNETKHVFLTCTTVFTDKVTLTVRCCYMSEASSVNKNTSLNY